MKLSKEEYEKLEGLSEDKKLIEVAALVGNTAVLFKQELIINGVDEAHAHKILLSCYSPSLESVSNCEPLVFKDGARQVAMIISTIWLALIVSGLDKDSATHLTVRMAGAA